MVEPFERSWRQVAFIAAMGAGALHLAAIRPHLHEWAPAAMFMLVAGVAQVGWGFWLSSRTAARAFDGGRLGAPVNLAGLSLNGGILVVWLISRTVGMPVGPHAGMAEHIHAADGLATALELLIVVSICVTGAGTKPYAVTVVGTALGVALAPFASSHDPAQERATVVAALALIVVVGAFIHAWPISIQGRTHVTSTLARRRYLAAGDLGRVVYGGSRAAR